MRVERLEVVVQDLLRVEPLRNYLFVDVFQNSEHLELLPEAEEEAGQVDQLLHIPDRGHSLQEDHQHVFHGGQDLVCLQLGLQKREYLVVRKIERFLFIQPIRQLLLQLEVVFVLVDRILFILQTLEYIFIARFKARLLPVEVEVV